MSEERVKERKINKAKNKKTKTNNEYYFVDFVSKFFN